jgi:hypothetical protein
VVESERPPESSDDRRRRYYGLTGAGRRAALAEVDRLRQRLAAAEATTLSRPRTPRLAQG